MSMLFKLPITALAFALSLAAPFGALAQDQTDQEESGNEESDTGENRDPSQFIGRYNGSSFETAMGMVVREDGTFQWGLSVGGLDLRAKGTWTEEAGALILVSDPKPIKPQFTWGALVDAPDGPFLRIVSAGTDRLFRYADIRGLCANGEVFFGAVTKGEWSPDEKCDAVKTIEFYLPSYQVLSTPFELVSDRAVRPGQTIRFDFHRNDLGLVNFDGMIGQIVNGELRLEGGSDGRLGAITLRKIVPQPE